MGHLLQERRDGDASPDSEFAATVVSVPCATESTLESLPATDAGALDPLAEAEAAARATLGSVGRYALKQPLGQGGLGTVFEAWDPLLSRRVAVKTLQFDLDAATRSALDRVFLNEARTAAGLNHAHIVTIHDAGLSAHGVYIAMERLHGRDLRQALQAGWLPSPAEAALLVRRIADALAYAHARGVVHCDVKPANIFVTRSSRPKVLDFGIARILHQAALPMLDGMVAGSPHYQAPEQLQAGPIDARTDLYALGTVLYELLSGRKAFGGATLEQIREAVMRHEPIPPHALRAEVPPELSAITLRAMARDPDARYASAQAMSQALRRWLARQAQAQQAAAAAPPRPAAHGTRRPLAWTALALALAAAAAGGLVLGAQPPSAAAATHAIPVSR